MSLFPEPRPFETAVFDTLVDATKVAFPVFSALLLSSAAFMYSNKVNDFS